MSIPVGWYLFHEYEEEIQHNNRFFLDKKFQRLFEKIIRNPSNRCEITSDVPLYRARINHQDKEFKYVHELRGNKKAPYPNRASPVGIPYTYLAGDVETAIAEIRANINQPITVAEFRLENQKEFIELGRTADFLCTGEDEFGSIELCSFILYLSLAFAKPVGSGREQDYLPCQYFAEYCKYYGFSGIKYISAARGFSSKNDCNNFVVFDDTDLVYRSAKKYTVTEIIHRISENGDVILLDDDE